VIALPRVRDIAAALGLRVTLEPLPEPDADGIAAVLLDGETTESPRVAAYLPFLGDRVEAPQVSP
jgi:hypothetical protein